MPSARGDRFWAFPLSGAPAVRICQLMGWPVQGAAYWTLVENFRTANAQERHGPWDLAQARIRGVELMLEMARDLTGGPLVIVALGARAAQAVAPEGVTLVEGEWIEVAGIQVVRIPHTSGRNRAWNEVGTAERVRKTLAEALRRAAA